MERDSIPNITSFMIRFVEEGTTNSAGEPIYRGSIRHIQTDQEMAFTRWQDAMEFIERYVPIQDFSKAGSSTSLEDGIESR